MKIYADECVRAHLVRALRDRGVDVLEAGQIEPAAQDESVLARANAAGAILLTHDKGFGELVFGDGCGARGVILIRVEIVSAEVAAAVASRVIDALTESDGAFVTLTNDRKRVRKL
jgi:predicted nuclease of predicted toxin-antitoxin system